jgi:hypothetical protein
VISLRNVLRFKLGLLVTALQLSGFRPFWFCSKVNGEDGTVHEIETFPSAGTIFKNGAGRELPT